MGHSLNLMLDREFTEPVDSAQGLHIVTGLQTILRTYSIQLTARVLEEYRDDEGGHFGFRCCCEGFVALKFWYSSGNKS